MREKLPFEGGVFRTGDQLIIKLNAFSPPVRQRFTLAHELAHLMLSPKATIAVQRSHVATDIESACDAIAAELLMPLEEVRELRGVPASVDALTRSARRFQVSLHAMAVRISELKIWKHAMGLWRWDNGATELWFVGRRLWPTRTPYFNAFELAMQSGRTIKVSEHYARMDGEHPALLEVRRLGENFLLAVILGM